MGTELEMGWDQFDDMREENERLKEHLKEQTDQSEDLLRRNEQLKEQLKRQTELEASMTQTTVNHLKQRIADLVEAGWTLNELAEGRRLGQPVSKTLHGRVRAARKLLNPGN